MPAFTKECKLCSHMNHFNSPKCKQCHAQLAIGGKLTAKVSLRKVRSVKCVEKNCRTCKQCTVDPRISEPRSTEDPDYPKTR